MRKMLLLVASVLGAAASFDSTVATDAAGIATVQFEMPTLSGEEPVLLIEVVHNGAKGSLRYQLRDKPMRAKPKS